MEIPEARLLSLTEVQSYKKPVWVEEQLYDDMGTDGFWILPFSKSDGRYLYFHNACSTIKTYNVTWRCWTDEPTRIQREETKWELE